MPSAFATFQRTARDSGFLWACASALDQIAPLATRSWWPPRLVAAERLGAQLASVLAAWGMPPDQTRTVVEKILYADLRGIDSHGCAMMPTYHRAWREGALEAAPEITVVRDAPATALLDGGGGLGHVPATRAMSLAIEKCRSTGVAAVAVRRSGHFGAAGAYAAMAAESGCIGIVTTSTPTRTVAPTFGIAAVLGTNPIAVAAPAGRHRPFLLDMATSTVSLGVLAERWRSQGRVPAGWAIDPAGNPLTRGARLLREGRLTPLGGDREHGSHKGYGLAVAVEILSALLPGLARRDGSARRAEVGHCMVAIDPARFRDEAEFRDDLDALIDELHATPPADPREPVRVAGDPEAEALAQRTARGIPLSRAVLEGLRAVARDSSVPFLLADDRGTTRRAALPTASDRSVPQGAEPR